MAPITILNRLGGFGGSDEMLGKHVTEGIELHKMTGGRWDPVKSRIVGRKPTGYTYWKLALRCSQCSNIIDECLCYYSIEEMELAKEKAKSGQWTCSVSCWFKGMAPKILENWINQFKKDRKLHIDVYAELDGKSREEKISILTEWFEDNDLGDDYSDMAEYLDSEECPF